MIRSFGISEAGSRQSNEDCFFADDELALFVVADGMGGHLAGEVASRLAVEAIENFIRRSEDAGDLSWPCGIDAELTLDGNRVRTAIYLANRRVHRAAESSEDYTGMGTTVVCALIRNGLLTIGHVGDSRLYLMVNGGLRQMTSDDTWIAALTANGNTDPVALANHPMRHVLTSVLGAHEQVEIHVSETRSQVGKCCCCALTACTTYSTSASSPTCCPRRTIRARCRPRWSKPHTSEGRTTTSRRCWCETAEGRHERAGARAVAGRPGADRAFPYRRPDRQRRDGRRLLSRTTRSWDGRWR